jgi:hypothetical protein
LLLCAWLCTGCADESGSFVSVGDTPDAGMTDASIANPAHRCDMVEMDGELVIEHEKDFTARYRVGEPSTKTIMLFGGESVEEENVLSNAYIIGLDQMDARMLAVIYPDFYLCSSPGGMEAAEYILPYDLVPATCEVYDQLLTAFKVFHRNRASGGDRTSLRLEGAPLELVSVTADSNGADVTDQVTDKVFHLVTAVEQLTGESVLSFGSEE